MADKTGIVLLFDFYLIQIRFTSAGHISHYRYATMHAAILFYSYLITRRYLLFNVRTLPIKNTHAIESAYNCIKISFVNCSHSIDTLRQCLL